MRKFRLGERVKARIPEATEIGDNRTGEGFDASLWEASKPLPFATSLQRLARPQKVDRWVSGRIIGISPDSKFAKLLLANDTELLIETRFLR